MSAKICSCPLFFCSILSRRIGEVLDLQEQIKDGGKYYAHVAIMTRSAFVPLWLNLSCSICALFHFTL